MRTEKQIAASRANGRKSSGATTADGKARIVAANLKSGVYAEAETLPWESADHLEQLKTEYYDHHQPASPEARLLVDELITCEWTLRRLRCAEAELWRHASRLTEGFAPAKALVSGDQSFARLQQRLNSTRTAYHRALKALHQLESAETPARTPKPETAADSAAPCPKPTAPNPQPPTPNSVFAETPKPPVTSPQSEASGPRPLTPDPRPPLFDTRPRK